MKTRLMVVSRSTLTFNHFVKQAKVLLFFVSCLLCIPSYTPPSSVLLKLMSLSTLLSVTKASEAAETLNKKKMAFSVGYF